MDASNGHSASIEALATRHHRLGWWALFTFATLGLVLESLAGMRVDWYVDANNETRHTMMRLAHAHGSLLAIVNVVFGLSLRARAAWPRRQVASACLVTATLAIPLGFLLGGVWFYGADPGLGIVLVPLGGITLLVALGLMASARST